VPGEIFAHNRLVKNVSNICANIPLDESKTTLLEGLSKEG
jgi:hypothetical protein